MEENTLINDGKLIETRINAKEAGMMSPLNLAYIGDAVYEIYIRKFLVLTYNRKVNDINKKCIEFVQATSQCQVVNALKDQLTENEIKVVKRGRNASSKTVPKNTNIIDYKMATGFEALLGYLYLIGDISRLEYIIDRSIKETINLKAI